MRERCEVSLIDVSKKSEVEDLKAFVLKEFGRIDGMVCGHQNKSHLKFEPFEQVTEENWDTVVEINLKGTFLNVSGDRFLHGRTG
jgi:NAD(P)-dependent dehydrogenase (short-subunit alcohol dehydrogenase family)